MNLVQICYMKSRLIVWKIGAPNRRTTQPHICINSQITQTLGLKYTQYMDHERKQIVIKQDKQTTMHVMFATSTK